MIASKNAYNITRIIFFPATLIISLPLFWEEKKENKVGLRLNVHPSCDQNY